jgi:hypothetical protein
VYRVPSARAKVMVLFVRLESDPDDVSAKTIDAGLSDTLIENDPVKAIGYELRVERN